MKFSGTEDRVRNARERRSGSPSPPCRPRPACRSCFGAAHQRPAGSAAAACRSSPSRASATRSALTSLRGRHRVGRAACPCPSCCPGSSRRWSRRRCVSKPPLPPPCVELGSSSGARSPAAGCRSSRSVPTHSVVIFSANTSAPPKCLDDLRAGVGRACSGRGCRPAAGRAPVREAEPPLRPFAAHLVELEHAVGLAPAGVVRDAPAGDERPGAVVHDAARLVLVHAEVDECRVKLPDCEEPRMIALRDRAGERVGACRSRPRLRSGRTSRRRGTRRCRRRARTGPWPCRRPGRAWSGRSRPSGRSAPAACVDRRCGVGERCRAPQNFQSAFGIARPR